jgi:hypothetical protein
MEGFMPIGLSLARVTPANNGAGAFAPLLGTLVAQLDRTLEGLSNLFRPLFVNIIDLMEGYRGTSLRVYETNPDLLGHAEAARWAVAYLSYVQMVELLGLIRGLYGRVGHVRNGLGELHKDLVGIAYDLSAFGNCACGLLQDILGELRNGIRVSGSFTLGLNFNPFKLLDELTGARFLKLLGLLALLVAFVVGLGLALRTFTLTAVGALLAISKFVSSMMPLIELLKKLTWSEVGVVAVGLAALAGFVYALGQALNQFNADVMKSLPNLSGFIEKLTSMASALAQLGWKEVLAMTVSLAALAGFIYALALATAKFTAESLNALPQLSAFINALRDLGTALGQLGGWNIVGMAVALAALAGFVYALAYGLNTVSASALAALPGLNQLIVTLGALAGSMANLGWEKLGIMALGLAAIALFVWALAAAAKFAGPELAVLAAVLSTIDKLVNSVTSSVGRLVNALSGVGSGILNRIMPGSTSLNVPGPATTTAGLAPPPPPLTSAFGAPVPTTPAATSFTVPPAGGAGVPGGMPSPEALANLTGGGAAPGAARAVDQSMKVEGGIHVDISAERLEANAAQILSDHIIRAIHERLNSLRSEQDFRTGIRSSAPV